jgi:hypothetical protein
VGVLLFKASITYTYIKVQHIRIGHYIFSLENFLLKCSILELKIFFS